MAEPRPIQAVVTAPAEQNPNERIEQIFLYNSDGTPYEGGGGVITPPSGSANVIVDSMGSGSTNAAVPANLTGGWSFGGTGTDWELAPQTDNVTNLVGTELVGVVHVVIPYSLIMPNVASGTETVLFTFEAKVYIDDVYLAHRIIAKTFPSKAGLASYTAEVSQAVIFAPATILADGSIIDVRITNGAIVSSAVMGGLSTLVIESPIYTFVGQ